MGVNMLAATAGTTLGWSTVQPEAKSCDASLPSLPQPPSKHATADHRATSRLEQPGHEAQPCHERPCIRVQSVLLIIRAIYTAGSATNPAHVIRNTEASQQHANIALNVWVYTRLSNSRCCRAKQTHVCSMALQWHVWLSRVGLANAAAHCM